MAGLFFELDIDMRKFLFGLLVVLFSIDSASAGSRPNVLIIMADDLGFNDLGYMGSSEMKTPHIDALAAGSVRFSDGHPSASVCAPSRAGMLTGRYQQRFGSESNGASPGLALSERTIADVMRKAGYRTGGIGKWHLGGGDDYYPTKRGFDYFCGLRGGSRSYFYSKTKADKPGTKSGQRIEENGKQIKFDQYLTDFFGDKAVDFIGEKSDKPFFLYLSFTAPHAPMHATEADLALFGHIEKPGRRKLAAMIYAMDRAVGNVVAELKRTGQFENTLIWFLSDNGGAQANGSNNFPLAGRKGIKFEGGIRVPFFVRWDARLGKKGRVYDEMISSLDIMPTSLVAGGGVVEAKMKLDGVDLLPHLLGVKQGVPHEKLYWHKLWFSAIREGDWKLMYFQDYGYALYNLANDLGEKNNILKDHPERVAKMKKDLNAWKGELMEPIWREGKIWFTRHLKTSIAIVEGREVVKDKKRKKRKNNGK